MTKLRMWIRGLAVVSCLLLGISAASDTDWLELWGWVTATIFGIGFNTDIRTYLVGRED